MFWTLLPSAKRALGRQKEQGFKWQTRSYSTRLKSLSLGRFGGHIRGTLPRSGKGEASLQEDFGKGAMEIGGAGVLQISIWGTENESYTIEILCETVTFSYGAETGEAYTIALDRHTVVSAGSDRGLMNGFSALLDCGCFAASGAEVPHLRCFCSRTRC